MSYIKKACASIFVITLFILLISCNNTKQVSKARRNSSSKTKVMANESKWKKQLHKMLTVGNKKLEGTQLQMIDYSLKGRIQSAEQAKHLVEKLLSGDRYVAYYNPMNIQEGLKLVKISDVKSGDVKSSIITYNFKRAKQYLKSTLHKKTCKHRLKI